MLSTITIGERLESVLAAGRVACPDCGEPLAPLGVGARARGADAIGRAARAPAAGVLQALRTHARAAARLLRAAPARWCEVIGSALLAKAQGVGHRTIAARLDRPPGTVRGWLRAFARRTGDVARRWRDVDSGAGRRAVDATAVWPAVR